jgi:hypothetical protein
MQTQVRQTLSKNPRRNKKTWTTAGTEWKESLAIASTTMKVKRIAFNLGSSGLATQSPPGRVLTDLLKTQHQWSSATSSEMFSDLWENVKMNSSNWRIAIHEWFPNVKILLSMIRPKTRMVNSQTLRPLYLMTQRWSQMNLIPQLSSRTTSGASKSFLMSSTIWSHSSTRIRRLKMKVRPVSSN